MLQKVQYDATGKLSVKSSSTVYFPNMKSHHPVLKEKTRNKVIILDTHKKNKPNAGKSGQGVASWVKVTQKP